MKVYVAWYEGELYTKRGKRGPMIQLSTQKKFTPFAKEPDETPIPYGLSEAFGESKEYYNEI
jgi:hypothetical protein